MKSGEPADEELVRRYQHDPDGEAGRAAAEALFDRYWERVYLWCYRRVGRHETARDITQDVLLNAYQALGRFEGRCLYSSWLYTIMRNQCFRALRRPSLIRDEEVELDHLPIAQMPADAGLVEREDEEALLALIRTHLDPAEQVALWMRVGERLPVEEITRRLGSTGASGARGVLQSARRKLRAAVGRGARGEEPREQPRGEDRA